MEMGMQNFRKFVESINYLGWESHFFIRPPRFFKYCLEVSMNTNQWKRLSWKTVYSMILANNNTKWVSSQLFGCSRAKLGPLGRGHLHRLFITELLLIKVVSIYLFIKMNKFSLELHLTSSGS